MACYRSEVVKLINSWEGLNEADGSFVAIIDTYNSLGASKLPRRIKMKYDWSWCACTWSALAIKLGYTNIMPIEISCGKLVDKAKKLGIWVENDNYIPNLGDGVLYDWEDTGKGDNTGWPDHIGTVVEVNITDGYFMVMEGNYDNAVKKRKVLINGKNIRGFITPKYDPEPVSMPTSSTIKPEETEMKQIKKGSKGKAVRVWQSILGYTGNDIDGKFGPGTKADTIAFQKKAFPNEPDEWDGVVGSKTWKAGLESVK